MAKKKHTDASVKPVKVKKPTKKAATKKPAAKKPAVKKAKKPAAKKTVKKPVSKKVTAKKPAEKKSEKTGATTVPVILNTGSVVMVAVDDPNTNKTSIDAEGKVVVRDANGKVIGVQG